MQLTKECFISLAMQHKALQFGTYKLKSGRISPYFFNAGLFYSNQSLYQLGNFYAKILIDYGLIVDHLFGPAYKGIPLVTATAIALAQRNKNVTVTFNRKEAKDHGEGGLLIGAPLTGSTVIIDDVITRGTAFREAQTLIQSQGAHLSAMVVALDRCERGLGEQSTLQDIRQQGIAVYSIITVHDLIDYLEKHQHYEQQEKINTYLRSYGE